MYAAIRERAASVCLEFADMWRLEVNLKPGGTELEIAHCV